MAASDPAVRRSDGRFAPGVSGNPGGRTRVTKRLADLARQYTELAIQTLAEIAGDGAQPASARVQASDVLLDRGWGRAPQTVKLDSTDDLTDEQLTDAIKTRLAALVADAGPGAAGAVGGGEASQDSPEPDGVVH